MFVKLLAATLFAFSLLATAAHAVVHIVLERTADGDAVLTYSGRLDLTGAELHSAGSKTGPFTAVFGTKGRISNILPPPGWYDWFDDGALMDTYRLLAPLPKFGSRHDYYPSASIATDYTGPHSGTGTNFSIGSTYLSLPAGYQSGDWIEGTIHASLWDIGGWHDGFFKTSLASGDSIVLQVGDVSSVPVPGGLPLLTGGLLAAYALRRRRAAAT